MSLICTDSSPLSSLLVIGSTPLSSAQIQHIFKFFQLALMHGGLAQEAAQELHDLLVKRKKNLKFETDFVRHSFAILQSKENTAEFKSHMGLPSEFQAIQMGPWRDFSKTVASEEKCILIWSHILGFSLGPISEALQVSVGTLEFRLNHAVRTLGLKTANSGATRGSAWN
jgi:hypothetical protein